MILVFQKMVFLALTLLENEIRFKQRKSKRKHHY
jgi:hypothetical protein